MGKRKSWTRDEWVEEVEYIEAVCRAGPYDRAPATFGKSWVAARKYIEMQKRFCIEDGFDGFEDLAWRLEVCRLNVALRAMRISTGETREVSNENER